MLTVKFDRFRYGAQQFALWRAAFGFYLLFYTFRVWPYANELYGSGGPYGQLNFGLANTSLFPRFLLKLNSGSAINAIFSISAVCALLIICGCGRRSAAFILTLLNMWIFNRLQLTFSPEAGFVNWLIAALIFIPAGEPMSIGKKNPQWHMPKTFYWGAWIVLSFAYFYSASAKFGHHDRAWMNGEALYDVMMFDNSRVGWYGDAFRIVPIFLFRIATWMALAMQLLTGVFVYFRRVRPWWWLVSTGTHIAFLGLANLAQLTWGMVFFHLFLFDLGWWEHAKAFVARYAPRFTAFSE